MIDDTNALYVYTGIVVVKSKRYYRYVSIDSNAGHLPDDNEKRLHFFSKPLKAGSITGGIYAVKEEEKVVSGAKYIEMWHDWSDTHRFLADSNIADVELKKEARAEKVSNLSDMTFEKAKMIYLQCRTWSERASFLSVIIEYITH